MFGDECVLRAIKDWQGVPVRSNLLRACESINDGDGSDLFKKDVDGVCAYDLVLQAKHPALIMAAIRQVDQLEAKKLFECFLLGHGYTPFLIVKQTCSGLSKVRP